MASCANVKARASPHACDRNVNGSSSRAAVPDATQSDQGIARRDGEQRAQADTMEAVEQLGPSDPSMCTWVHESHARHDNSGVVWAAVRDACHEADLDRT